MGSPIGSIALAAAMIFASTGAQAFDETKYPDWSGQWRRPPGVGNQWDTSKPPRQGQAPLTPEYQAIYEANLADQAAGGQGTDPTYTCIPDGMPRAMIVILPMEIVILPKITYIMIEYLNMLRRIYTDGRDWPENAEPSFVGYSIGKWIDEDGDGRYDVLEIETRHLKGPAHLRRQRHPPARGQPDRRQGAHLPRQGRSERPARRDHDDRQRADAPLDGDQEIQSRAQADLGRGDICRGQSAGSDRQGELHGERRRLSDARQEGAGRRRICGISLRPGSNDGRVSAPRLRW